MKINPNEWYSIRAIEANRLLPMIKSGKTVVKWIERGLIKANYTGIKNGKRYKIKGKWLIDFLAKWDSGDFHS